MEDMGSQEKKVEAYVQDGKKDEAVKLLFDLITRYAQTHKFEKAESLRERLYEIDSLALDEIVKSAEIIEHARFDAMDPSHMDAWSELYRQLTKEESIALYYGMQNAVFDPGEIIYRQGKMNPNLYFVNAGEVKLFYAKDQHAILLKTLGPGHLAGEDTFFTSSTCTTSLMAHTRVKLSVLEKTVLQKWQADEPNLVNKLQDFCSNREPIKELLQKKELERRAHPRYDLTGSTVIQILEEQKDKAFKADLSDISTSGVSFIINTSPTAAESLLGSRLKLNFTLHGTYPKIHITQEGRIVGVHAQMFNEYFINVKWEQPLDSSLFDRIIMALR